MARGSSKRAPQRDHGMVRAVSVVPSRHGRPEAQLLLCCARTRVPPDIAERIAALLEQDLEWRYVVEAAAAHRVLPLLHNSLTATGSSGIPDDVRTELNARVLANAERDMLLVGELIRLLVAFEAAGVRAIPFKGPAVAASVYRNLALRRFFDLDVLIHPQDLREARSVLRTSGYRQIGHHAPGWEAHFMERGGRWVVDLHERIAPRYFPTVATFDELRARCETVVIHGRPVLTLGTVDLLLVLSVQLAKDCRCWKQRLVQICDTAELIRGSLHLEWDDVLRRARAIGGCRFLLLNVLLANDLLDAELPESVCGLARADPVVATLAVEVCQRLFPWPVGTGRPLPIGAGMPPKLDSWFHLRGRERLRDRITYVYQLLLDRVSLLVTPTARDRAFVRLPGRLDAVYYVVRPFRVLWQATRTGRLKSSSIHPDGERPCESARTSAQS
jgi:hypothetical protein